MRRIAGIVASSALVALALACADQDLSTANASRTIAPNAIAAQRTSAGDSAHDLAVLRATVAPLRRFAAAQSAGYTVKVTSCMSDATGGMGFHWGKGPYIVDGLARADQPEVLLFEPQANGELRFVGVEYVVPFDLWTKNEPPHLFGRDFTRNLRFGVWALHVWVGADNPSGIFAPFNPRVSCANTTDVDIPPAGMAMAH